MNVVLEADSAEGEQEGQLRRWYVTFARSGVESSTLTPLRSARSRSERSMASRRLLTRDPTAPSTAVPFDFAASVAVAMVMAYVITYVRMSG